MLFKLLKEIGIAINGNTACDVISFGIKRFIKMEKF